VEEGDKGVFAPCRVGSLAGLFKEVLLATPGTSHTPGSMLFTPFLPPLHLVTLIPLLGHGHLPRGRGVQTAHVTKLCPVPGWGGTSRWLKELNGWQSWWHCRQEATDSVLQNVKVSRKDPEERAVLWDTTEELSYGRGKLREPKRPLGAWRHRFQRLLAHVAKSFR
jgi:hypothetical protein